MKILQELPQETRRPVLTEFVKNSVEIVWDGGYHFSDFCRALADFASREAEVKYQRYPERPPELLSWQILAALFRAAAQEAEAPGREVS